MDAAVTSLQALHQPSNPGVHHHYAAGAEQLLALPPGPVQLYAAPQSLPPLVAYAPQPNNAPRGGRGAARTTKPVCQASLGAT